MIIIHFWGGIGNQMFIYALYKQLEFCGKDVRADLGDFEKGIDKRPFLLDAFDINLKRAEKKDFWKIQKSLYYKLKYIYFCLNPKLDSRYTQVYYEKGVEYDNNIFLHDNIFIQGYWQNPKYFSKVSDDIKKIFKFTGDIYPSKIKNDILSSEAVSLHVRLTDYLDEDGMGKICSPEYYKNAIRTMNEKIDHPKYFVFSDDIPLTQKILGKEVETDVIYVDNDLNEDNTLRDLYYMSLCKHHIIANSTYSWWGAWIGTYDDSVIMIPRLWNKKRQEWDMALPSWIKIDID